MGEGLISHQHRGLAACFTDCLNSVLVDCPGFPLFKESLAVFKVLVFLFTSRQYKKLLLSQLV